MAIIKCPECGHMVSDQAPVCPSCGVQIAGHVVTCPACGATYLDSHSCCPSCHRPTTGTEPADDMSAAPSAAQAPSPGGKQPSSRRRRTVVIALVIALILCATGFYFYDKARNSREAEAYAYAMQSSDPQVLQSFLDTYTDATGAHRDSIQTRLAMLRQLDAQWQDVLVSNSRSALEAYLEAHPDTPHKDEALSRIDSIDWCAAGSRHSADAYQSYLEAHPDGKHAAEADDSLKSLLGKTLQPDERQMVARTFQLFFQSLGDRDEDALLSCIATPMSSFLEKADATAGDVLTFMHKLYKSGVTRISWKLQDDLRIDKRNIGVDEYEYHAVFTADEQIELSDTPASHGRFRVRATVSPDGKITSFGMDQLSTP